MTEPVTYFWIALAAIILLVDLWAIISVFRSDKPDVTGVLGPRGIKRGTGSSSSEHSKGEYQLSKGAGAIKGRRLPNSDVPAKCSRPYKVSINPCH